MRMPVVNRGFALRLLVVALSLCSRVSYSAEGDGAGALEIVVDTSKAPEMATWAARAKAVGEQNYRLVCQQLAGPGFSPPTKVRLVVEPRKGVAATSGTVIYCSAVYFQSHPDDLGAIVHELCHVVQAYGKHRGSPSSASWAVPSGLAARNRIWHLLAVSIVFDVSMPQSFSPSTFPNSRSSLSASAFVMESRHFSVSPAAGCFASIVFAT